jgi:anti-anti-sigma factor
MTSNLNPAEPVLTFRVSGDLISTSVEGLRKDAASFLDAADGPPPAWNILHLDLTAAKMVDSVGLNLVVALLKRAQKHGRRMRVTCGSANVVRTFAFTRLDQHVELVKA